MSGLPVTDLLKRMVRFPSISRGDEVELVAWLADHLDGLGLQPVVSGRNVYAVVGHANGGPTLLLNSHIDVVPPGDAWSTDPWEPVEVDGVLYGRGANDAKGCCAAMLTVAHQLSQEKLPGLLVLALTCDEETGGEGLEVLIDELPPIDAAVIGEPTGNRPALGMRGLVSIRLRAQGRGCHASRPHEGTNPIYPLARDLLAIEAMSPRPPEGPLGAPTWAATVVESGAFTARNRVPDVAEAILDLRTTPGWDNQTAVDAVCEAVDESEVIVRSMRIRPKLTAPEARIAQAALRASGADDWYGFRGACDLFHVDAPAVVMGPGNTSSHQPDEHIELVDVERAVRVYRETVERYFAG